jgi:hypothetical protein
MAKYESALSKRRLGGTRSFDQARIASRWEITDTGDSPL